MKVAQADSEDSSDFHAVPRKPDDRGVGATNTETGAPPARPPRCAHPCVSVGFPLVESGGGGVAWRSGRGRRGGAFR